MIREAPKPIVAIGHNEFNIQHWREAVTLHQGDFKVDAHVIEQAELLLIWNGQQREQRDVVEWARCHRVPYLTYEQGAFGQMDNYLWDDRGFNAQSSLNDPVVATDAERATFEAKRTLLQSQYPLEPDGSVLVPLQIQHDTQVRFSTPYRTMNELIDELAVRYPSQPVTIRPHPKHDRERHPLPILPSNFCYESNGRFVPAAAKASVVVGLTSTCLWEALVLGVPVVALGDHPLRAHPRRQHDEVGAKWLGRNLPRPTPLSRVLATFNLENRWGVE